MDAVNTSITTTTLEEWEALIAQAVSDITLPTIRTRQYAAYSVHEAALTSAFKSIMIALEAARGANANRVRVLVTNNKRVLPRGIYITYGGSFRDVFETTAAILQRAGCEVSHQYTPKPSRWGIYPIYHPTDEGVMVGMRISAPAVPWARTIGSLAMTRIARWWKGALSGHPWKAIMEAEAKAEAEAEAAEAEAEAKAEAAEAAEAEAEGEATS